MAADSTTAANVSFYLPTGVAIDGTHTNLYVADNGNDKIRKIAPASGSLSAMTLVNAVVSSLTGTADTVVTSGAADGAAVSASFSSPADITTDGNSLYVTDTGSNTMRQIK